MQALPRCGERTIDGPQLVRRLGMSADDIVAVASETPSDLIVLVWRQTLGEGHAHVVSETLAHTSIPVLVLPVDSRRRPRSGPTQQMTAGGFSDRPRCSPSPVTVRFSGGGDQMATKQTASSGAHVGDMIEVRGIHGESARRGEIVELLGREGHEHYRVRWDEQHESIVYPADGVVITPGPGRGASGAWR